MLSNTPSFYPPPITLVKEIHRVLSPGGHFFVGEEPYKKILHVNLYTGEKVYSKKSLNASKIRKIFDYFFSKRSCNEIEHLIENDGIPIGIFRQALTFFEEKNVKLQSPIKNITSELYNPKHYIKFLLAYLLGGSISGICRKFGVSTKRETSVHDILICPSCLENGRESKLNKENLSFFCSECGHKFPIINDVVFLFSYKKFEEFYPEIFGKVTKGSK